MTKITNDKLFGPDFLGPQKQSMQELIDLTVKLQTQMKELLQIQKATLKKEDTKTTDGLKKRKQALTLVNAVSKEMIRLEKQRLSLTAQVVSATSDEAKHVKRLQVAKQQLNKTTKQEAILNSKLTTEYQKQSTRLNKLRSRYKDLILTEGQFSAKTREVGRQVSRLDTRLKAVDGAAGQFQRNVGNYPQTFAKATAALRRFGLAMGGIAIFKNALSTVTSFEQAQADLGAISQSSSADLEKLSDQAKDLGKVSQFTATEISGLQVELAKLGFTTDEILQSTTAIQNFAAATGAELPAAAALAGSALRAFGLDASEMDRVVSTLGVATTKSALDFQKLETGLSTVAPVAKAFGFSIEDTTALLGQLANSGFDASSAATATRNILLNLADANGDLAQSLGRPITSADDLAEGLAELQARGIDLATALELTDKRSVAAFNTFIEGSGTLVEFRDSITGANEQLQEMADQRLDTVQGQTKLLSSAWQGLLIDLAEGNGIFGSLKDAIGFVARNLRSIIKVVLAGVAGWVSYRIALKLVNRETGKFIGLGMITKMRSMVKTIAIMTKGTRGLALGFKRVGTAIKGIPLANLISGLVTVTTLVFEFVGGVDESTEALDAEADALRESNIELTERQRLLQQFAGEQKSISEQIVNLQSLTTNQVQALLTQTKSQIDTAKELGAEESKNAASASANFKEFIGQAVSKEERTKELARLQQVVTDAQVAGDALAELHAKDALETGKILFQTEEDLAEGRVKSATRTAEAETERIGLTNDQIALIEKELERRKALGKVTAGSSKGTKRDVTELQKLQKVLKDLNVERANELILRGETLKFINLTDQARAKDKEIKDILEKLKLTSKLTDNREREIALIQAEIDSQRELSTLITDKITMEEFGQAKAQNARDLAIETAKINIEFNKQELASIFKRRGAGEILAKDTERINQLKLETLQLEQEIRDTVLDKRLEDFRKGEIVLINEFNKKRINGTFKTNEELVAAENKLQKELLEIRIEALLAERQTKKNGSIEAAELDRQILEAEVELQDHLDKSRQETIDKEKDFFNQRLKATQEFAEEIRKIEERRINKQIEGIDREIEESQRREDMLTALAVNGNQTATESISAEIRKQEDLQRRKDALEKKKARQKALVDSLGLLEQKIENDEVDPVTSTIRDMTKLFAVISTAIPGFYKGTKTTVKDALGGPQLSGRDGYIVRVDGSEKVLNPELSKKTGNMTTDEIVDRAVMHKIGVHDDHQFIEPIIREIHQPFQSPQAMLHKLDSIEKAINNKEVYLGGEFINNYEYWQERIKAGNKTIKNLHKTDSING